MLADYWQGSGRFPSGLSTKHGFFYYHAGAYRQQQAMDGWSKVFAFFQSHLH